MRNVLILVLIATIIGLVGCRSFAPQGDTAKLSIEDSPPSATHASAQSPMMGGAGMALKTQKADVSATSDNAPAAPAAESSKQDASLAILAQSQPDRYLIRNATVTVETYDVRDAVTRLTTAIAAAHGYLADMHESTDGLGVMTATMSVRVPYTSFDKSMQEIGALGKMLDRQATAEDVTEEFVDTQARIRNLKSTELRLLEHLSRTGRLADTLLVEKELNRVREEIEQHEGRVRFLAHRIAFSTITLTLKDKPRQTALVPAATYSPGKEGSEAVRSLVDFGRALLTYLIWIAVWIPVWIPLAFGGWVGARAGLRWSVRVTQQQPQVAGPTGSPAATVQPTA